MTMIDLWTFQKWDTIQNAFNTHGVYTASWSKSIFVGDDNAIKSGYTDTSNVSIDDISAIRDQFTPAYEWLASMMIQHGITPIDLTGFTTNTTSKNTNLNSHDAYNHKHDTNAFTTSLNNHQLIDTNTANNVNTNSHNFTTSANENASASVFTVSTTTNAVNTTNASANAFNGSTTNGITNDNAAITTGSIIANTANNNSDTTVKQRVAPIWFYAKWCKFEKDTFKITEVGGKPDMRLNEFKDYTDDLIHIRIPLNRLMLTDFEAWHCVLNDAPCPPASSESWSNKQWDEWFNSTDKWSYERIASSWSNCIITGSDDVILEALRSKSQPAFIQATCWYLKPEDVIKVYPSSKD